MNELRFVFGRMRGKSWNSVALGNHRIKSLDPRSWWLMFHFHLTAGAHNPLSFRRRAVAQRCPSPPMNNLISIGGQHQGNFDLCTSFSVTHQTKKNLSSSICTGSQPCSQNPVSLNTLGGLDEEIGRGWGGQKPGTQATHFSFMCLPGVHDCCRMAGGAGGVRKAMAFPVLQHWRCPVEFRPRQRIVCKLLLSLNVTGEGKPFEKQRVSI